MTILSWPCVEMMTAISKSKSWQTFTITNEIITGISRQSAGNYLNISLKTCIKDRYQSEMATSVLNLFVKNSKTAHSIYPNEYREDIMENNWLYLNIKHGSTFELWKLWLVPCGTVTPDVRQPWITLTEVINIIQRWRKQLMHHMKQLLVLSAATQLYTAFQNYYHMTNRHPFNGLFSRTTCVSLHQKG